MSNTGIRHNISGIDLTIIYSRRRTIGISVRQDASVIIRVPARTPMKTIERIVAEKTVWIIKHRDNYRDNMALQPGMLYRSGEIHMFRGRKLVMNIEKSEKSSIRFGESSIDIGIRDTDDPSAVKKILYRGYRDHARKVFPHLMSQVIEHHSEQKFSPVSMVTRTMKRRWGSCSPGGVITLNTELIKLPDRYIEYVITHELCHLRHHNHGKQYYKLLSELYPNWKETRKEMRKFLI
jgi:predicted metal-dependent hydrolase